MLSVQMRHEESPLRLLLGSINQSIDPFATEAVYWHPTHVQLHGQGRDRSLHQLRSLACLTTHSKKPSTVSARTQVASESFRISLGSSRCFHVSPSLQPGRCHCKLQSFSAGSLVSFFLTKSVLATGHPQYSKMVGYHEQLTLSPCAHLLQMCVYHTYVSCHNAFMERTKGTN